MKKIIYILTTLVLSVSIVSCNVDAEMPHIDKEYLGAVDASFRSTVLSHPLASKDNGEIKIHLVRGISEGTASVPISLSGKDLSMFTLKTPTVQFAAGETEAFVVLGYDISDFKPAVKYALTLSISDETMVSLSQVSTLNITAEIPLSYEFLGVGSYTSTFFSGSPWDVDIYVATITPTFKYYKVVDCIMPGYDYVFSVSDGVMSMEQQNIGYWYSDAHGYVYIQPQTMTISGKNHTIIARFVLPASGASFSGTFQEIVTLP